MEGIQKERGICVPWQNGSKAASIQWWQCWKMSSAFSAKGQQPLIEHHNHTSEVDSAANLTNQHWNVRTVMLAKQTAFTILKAQNMWQMKMTLFDAYWSLLKIMVQTQNSIGVLDQLAVHYCWSYREVSDLVQQGNVRALLRKLTMDHETLRNALLFPLSERNLI